MSINLATKGVLGNGALALATKGVLNWLGETGVPPLVREVVRLLSLITKGLALESKLNGSNS